MPSQPPTKELVSVDNWYETVNSAPTTTEVLLYTLLIELVVGADREPFIRARAFEAEMTPNTEPQGGGGGGEGIKKACTQPWDSGPVPGDGAVQLQQGRRPVCRQVLVNSLGAGRLDGVLPSANLHKYLWYHGEGKLLGPAPAGTKSKGQKRAVAALPQIIVMMKAKANTNVARVRSGCE